MMESYFMELLLYYLVDRSFSNYQKLMKSKRPKQDSPVLTTK